MNNFIQRNYQRTEKDDYILNVQSILDRSETKESLAIYYEDNIVGWEIIIKYC